MTIYCAQRTGHTTDFVLDLAVDDEQIYVLSIGSNTNDLNKVGLCSIYLLLSSLTITDPVIIYNINSGTNGFKISFAQIATYTYSSVNPYWHFAQFTGGGNTPISVRAKVSHEYDSNFDNYNQRITIQRFDASGILPSSIVLKAFRPPENTDMKLVTTGGFSSFLNIRHFIAGRLVYLDVWNLYNALNTNDLTGYKFWRMSMSQCDDAFSGVSLPADVATNSLNDFVMVNCQKDNILASFVYSAEPAYTALMIFPSTATNKVRKPSSQSTMSLNGSPRAYFAQTLDLKPWADVFAYMPPYTLSPSSITVTENSYKTLPFTRDGLIGATMRVLLEDPKIAGVLVLDNKQHIVRFSRSDTGASKASDADQVYLNSVGGVYDDDYGKMGIMSCSELGNYTIGSFDRSCLQLADYVPSPQATIESTLDMAFLQDRNKVRRTRRFLKL